MTDEQVRDGGRRYGPGLAVVAGVLLLRVAVHVLGLADLSGLVESLLD